MKQELLYAEDKLNIVYYSTLFLTGKIDESRILKILGMNSSTALAKARDIIKAEAKRRGVDCQEATAELLEQKKFELAIKNDKKI